MMQPLPPVNRTLSAPRDALRGQVRALIQAARQQTLRAVDVVQVRTDWEIGRHVVKFEQEGDERAEYGE